ncbi:MAG: TetR/AcrR family transcriptional regulator [Jatrophihabitantaceae bacterium]
MAQHGRLITLVRTDEPDDDGRSRVLDAAVTSFIDFGIRRTSMAEIAKRSRLSPATLYRRFAQKSDLVQSVGLREVRRFVAHVDSCVDHDASAQEQIVEMFVAFASGLRRNKLLRRLLATEPEIVLPLLTTRGAPILDLGRDYLAEFIARLQSEGKLPAYDPKPVAEMIARIGISLALTPQTSIPLGSNAAARQFAVEHITVGFRLPPPAESSIRASA